MSGAYCQTGTPVVDSFKPCWNACFYIYKNITLSRDRGELGS
jgi:hypothetical protein